jgi:DNA-binding beta-propeller fold protein YncE
VAAAAVALAIAAGVALGGGVSWAATAHAAAAVPAWRPGSLQPGYITTVAGDLSLEVSQHFAGDGGPAAKAAFVLPSGIAIDPARGYLYIADRGNERIRRIDSHGTITTIAGNGVHGFKGDGGPATESELNDPIDVAVGPDGSVYLAEVTNDRIRRIDTHGIITTVAGTGHHFFGGDDVSGGVFSGDGVPAGQASLDGPASLAIDSRGDIYLADEGHDRIRRIDTHGIITTVAGTGAHGFGGDGGPATAARLASPKAVALGPDGSLYVADLANQRIRRINPEGVITTIAGDGTKGNTGDGGNAIDAEVDLGEAHLAVDRTGTVYLTSGTRIRRIDSHGIITTVAGSAALSGKSLAPLTAAGPISQAPLGVPASLAIDDGILYLMDEEYPEIRAVRITAAPGGH